VHLCGFCRESGRETGLKQTYCQIPQEAELNDQPFIMEDEAMRELKMEDLALVSGAGSEQVCTAQTANNNYYGVQNTSTIGPDLINIYEGLVSATSHIIERVALALD
jgi:hypothetical protein